MILKDFPYSEVFPLGGDLTEETLVAKLNANHQLQSEELTELNKHPDIFGQIRRLSVECILREDIRLIEGFCRQCPQLASLTIDAGNRTLELIKRQSQILGRLTKLTATVANDKYFPSLNSICQLCPKLELNLCVVEPMQKQLFNYPQVTRRLSGLILHGASPERLPSLQAIVRDRQDPLNLELRTWGDFRALINYPQLLSGLTAFTGCVPIGERGFDWVDDICRMSPSPLAMSLKVEEPGLERNLMKHPRIFPRLRRLALSQIGERGIPLCKEIHRRCPQLEELSLQISLGIWKRIAREFPAINNIIYWATDDITVGIGQHQEGMEIQCMVRDFPDLLPQVHDSLEHLTTLTLPFTGLFSEDSLVFNLLRYVADKSPNLRTAHLRWDGPGESPAQLRRLVEKALQAGRSSTSAQKIVVDFECIP